MEAPRTSLADRLHRWLQRHPRWVGATFAFCLFMTFVYVPFDFLLKPLWQDVSQAEEVWFGVMLRGWAAKATEPLHGAIYAALSWGLWKDRAWVWPALALYTGQVALGMLVWNVLYPERGMGWPAGLAVFALFAALAGAFWRHGRRAPAAA